MIKSPIYLYHGKDDAILDPGGSKALVTAMNAAGADKLSYTEVDDMGHQAPSEELNDELVAWLLGQIKPAENGGESSTTSSVIFSTDSSTTSSATSSASQEPQVPTGGVDFILRVLSVFILLSCI